MLCSPITHIDKLLIFPRDSFDKFSMRHDIDMLMEELWRDAACKDAIRACVGKGPGE